MSKRPTTAGGVLSRLRPAGRLRDLSIWSKLGLIMMVPTIATLLVTANGAVERINTSNNADRARTLSKLTKDVGQLVHDLQEERATAILVLSLEDPQRTASIEAYRKIISATDGTERSYSLHRNSLTGVPANFESLLDEIDSQLADLRLLREKVLARSDASLTYTAFLYRVVIANLVALRESAAQVTGEADLGDRMRAAAAVSSMKEFVSQERIAVLRAIMEMDTSMPASRAREVVNALSGQEQALQTFAVVATPEERSLFDQKVAGEDLRQAELYEGQVESVISGASKKTLQFAPVEWDNALRERGNLLRAVEVELDNRLEAQATELRDAVVRQVLIEVSLLLGMLLLGILFAWLVARSMARSLRELRQGALAVAEFGLPQAVARLRDPALATQMSPTEVAKQIANPLPVRSKDEFGQVAEAFNTVHMEAVRTAAEQAALRGSVATMFVNLARRSQILVDRLIGHLDRLERGEEDPDRLAELFQLDHLATRMRRNDENLLVLAGADSTRVQRQSAVLLDVLRAAQSEVEHYTRIEFGVIDRDIEIAAHAVNDMVHLIAELLENATSFSPPDSAVVVEARRVGDRAVLLVEDRGIGMSAEQFAELNERLAAPPMVDVAVSRMMGLVVVARLAARHGVKVELRPAREGGTIADVTLPPSLLVPRGPSGRAPGGRELPPNRQQVEGPPPRPAFSPPLALESGPSATTTLPESALRKFDPRPVDAPNAPVPGGDSGFSGPAGARGLPAWSDLTGASGANGANGTDSFGTRPSVAMGAEPLPQRRPSEGRTVEGEVTSGSTPLIPRQFPVPSGDTRPNGFTFGAEGPPVPPAPMSAPPFPVSAPPVSAPPVASAPPVSAPPVASAPPATQAPPQSPPPVWPPIAPSSADTSATPSAPGEFSAPLDMTAEMPKIPEARQAPTMPAPPPVAARPGPAASAPVSAPPDPRMARYADETMELPIFRELESAWFRTRRPASGASQSEPAVTGGTDPANAGARGSASPDAERPQPGTTTGSTSMIGTSTSTGPTGPAGQAVPAGYETAGGASSSLWRTAADDGWRAASAAAEVEVVETTGAGLPRRVPMAQLVPGGVEKAANTTQRRTPEAVRGLLSAYHRGVQRGRTQPKDPQTPEPTTARPQTPQAGKEHEA